MVKTINVGSDNPPAKLERTPPAGVLINPLAAVGHVEIASAVKGQAVAQDIDDQDRVTNQFEDLRLGEIYTVRAASEISTMEPFYKKVFIVKNDVRVNSCAT